MASYSFLDVKGTINGPGGESFSIGSNSGNAEEGITIENIEEKDLMVLGASGEVMHSLRANNAGRLTLRLLKTSPVNAALSDLYNVQRASSSLWGQNVIVITDIQRGDVEALTQAAFVKPTANTYAKDAGMQEWVFQGVRDMLLGAGVPDVNT